MWNFLKRLLGIQDKPKPAEQVTPPVAPAVGRDVTPPAMLKPNDAPAQRLSHRFHEEREPPLHLRNKPKKAATSSRESPRLLRPSVRQPESPSNPSPIRDDSSDLLVLGTSMYLMSSTMSEDRPSPGCSVEVRDASGRYDSASDTGSYDSGSNDSSSCD